MSTLVHDVEAAIRTGLAGAWRRGGSKAQPTEPELVAALFTYGLPALNAAVAAHMPNGRVSGVFCHSRPIVTTTSVPTWSCELGDLLVLARHAHGGTATNTALLLQFKRGEPPASFPAGVPQRQATLYRRWPEFKLFGERRRVREPIPHQGAQFSFLEVCRGVAAGCSHCTMLERIPGDQAFRATLADELAAAVQHRGGRRFADEAAVISRGETGWSRIVWDVLRRSLDHAWRVAGGDQAGRSRAFHEAAFVIAPDARVPALLQSDPALLKIATQLYEQASGGKSGDEPPDLPPLDADLGAPPPGDGLSIVFVETGDVDDG